MANSECIALRMAALCVSDSRTEANQCFGQTFCQQIEAAGPRPRNFAERLPRLLGVLNNGRFY